MQNNSQQECRKCSAFSLNVRLQLKWHFVFWNCLEFGIYSLKVGMYVASSRMCMLSKSKGSLSAHGRVSNSDVPGTIKLDKLL